MPSKGVQCYTYIAQPGCSIELSVPKHTVTRTGLREFRDEDMEVESRNIDSLLNKSGRFAFKVLHDGTLITEQWVNVNALTGNLGDGTLKKINETQSVIHDESHTIVSYGFYAAGGGHAGLPTRHQCYITVTPDYADWMAQVAPDGSPLANDRPFKRLALPAAHDVGMNSMENCDAVLAHAGSAVITTLIKESKWAGEIADAISGKAIEAIAPNIVSSLAITQKDTLETILRLGARYFEFRPAHCHEAVLPSKALPDGLYFQHSAIPGMAYEHFLRDIAHFLVAHPSEIVVTQLRWDGVPNACRRPNDQEMKDHVEAIVKQVNGALAVGNQDDLQNRTIADLRRDRKRLIVLINANSLSTYTDEGNATLDGDSIVRGFDSILTPDNARGRAFVNLQCQATATNIPGAVVYSILSATTSNSCILATKALCDSKTLPWIRDNAARACGNDNLVVVMNDFFDGATADVAVELSRQRLA